MIVYKITNRIDGKVYIGQTIKPLAVRWKRHCNPANDNCVAIHRAIKKYGKENFTIEQIDVACTRDELDAKEQYWIKFYDSMNSDKGYNLKSGGTHCMFSESTRQKLRNAMLGKKLSAETRIKQRLAHIGLKMTPESIRKSVVTKRANGFYQKNADVARMNGKKSSKKVKCVETGEVFDSITDASVKHNVHRANISACLHKKHETCGGKHWEFEKGVKI